MNEEDRAGGSPKDGITRRDLMQRAAATAAMGMFLPGMEAAPSARTPPLDLAEFSYWWLGVERARLARGWTPNGEHMYVEYQVPRQVKHPYPIVLVHGGNGQGLDWMGTPDGRGGGLAICWKRVIRSTSSTVQGRAVPSIIRLFFGNFGAAPTYEKVSRSIAALAKNPTATPGAGLHSQWPGSGEIGDPALDQFLASLGQVVPDSGYPAVSAVRCASMKSGDRAPRCCWMRSAPQSS